MATTTTNAEVAAHGGGGEFPPFNTATYPGQLLWLALTFGFLYWMMATKIVPRLGGIIETRRNAIAADLAAATERKTQADRAGEAYEESLGSARSSAQSIAGETRTRLTAETDARRKAIEADLAARMAEADATIRARTADAMSNVRVIASDAAGAIVERLTGRTPDPAVLDAAVDRAKA